MVQLKRKNDLSGDILRNYNTRSRGHRYRQYITRMKKSMVRHILK